MKSNYLSLKHVAVAIVTVLIANSVYSQSLEEDTVSVYRSGKSVTNQPIQTYSNQTRDDAKDTYYKWQTPILEKVDLESIQLYKNDHERYLTNIETFEGVLKKNKKELNSQVQQAKDQAKALSNEKKNLNDKRKFYKEDEKLAKREKKLRDNESKLILKEKKSLKKQSKDLSSYDVENRMRQYEDREYRIEIAEQSWKEKRDATQLNIEKLAEVEKVLNEKDMEIKTRLRELDFYKRDLDLQFKQLDIERKQTKLEIKKAKAALKQQK